ncbi:diguanylate cyclase domain-containing protein [Alteromonas sp. AMM-1]|uniref:diguanylate cyclase domain-containing protein n=1 Tax=Alteromonas sp. AMM-1 TaxID=3394233 RepID=UPI0039A70E05
MNKLQDKLHVRLAFVVAVVGILISIAGSLIVFQLAQAEQQRFSQHLVNQIAQGSVKPAAIAVYVNDAELAKEIIESLQINDLVLAAEIRNEAGIFAETSLKNESAEAIVLKLPHPFISNDFVGELLVYPDNVFIQGLAVADARNSVWEMMMVSMALTLTMYIAIYQLLSRPLIKLYHAFERVDPSNPEFLEKIDIQYTKKDEVGFLISGINRLIHAVRINFVAERRLRMRTEKLEQRFRLVFDKASVGIGLISTRKGILLENPVFHDIVGQICSLHDFIHMFDTPDQVTEAIAELRATQQSGPITLDLSYRNSEQQVRWLNCLFALVIDQRSTERNDDMLIEVILNDVTDRKEKESKAKYLAQHDALTGLLNRHGGELKLQMLMKSVSTTTVTAIMLIDLDNFKPINDSYGHDAGDAVLQETAQRIKRLFNDPDDVCCRWGGDEFVIGFRRDTLLPSAMETLCNTLLHGIEAPIALSSTQYCAISASIGVALVDTPPQSLEDILNEADEAMYQVKRQGRSNYLIV